MLARAAMLGVFLAAGLSGCDRVWTYRVVGMPTFANRSWFDVEGPAETRLRVSATLFAASLWLKVELHNVGDSPLQLRPDKLVVLRGGDELPLRGSVRCEGRPEEEVVVLAQGGSCLMRAEAYAPQSDAKLRELTLMHRGVSRAGKPAPVRIPLAYP